MAADRAWSAAAVLGEVAVPAIDSHLSPAQRVPGDPHQLAANAGRCFQGAIVLGLGFVLEVEQARELIERDSRNADVLRPYMIGEDLQGRPDQSPGRWVINFGSSGINVGESWGFV